MSKHTIGLSTFALRTIAMVLMLIDHIGYVLLPDQLVLRYIGRLAFPIFAFLIVEGYFHTRDIKKYLLRLLGLAIVTDLPYYFMSHQNWVYYPFKNVVWTFLFSLVAIALIDKLRKHSVKSIWLPLSLLIGALASYIAFLAYSDYHYMGVLMVLTFYYFRGQGLPNKLGQLLLMIIINIGIASIIWFQGIPFLTLENFPLYWERYGILLLPQQIWAVLALTLIWFYNGKEGYKSPISQTASYLFYPLHMVLLGFIKLIITSFFV